MNSNGTFEPNDARPDFAWPDVRHSSTKNNRRVWPLDRPVPLNYEVPMDWHHMIPWNTLRDAWSALAASQRWEVIEAWLNLLSVEDADQRLAEMKAGTLNTVDAEDLTEKLCWAKWNLVEGPTNGNRTDDPGGEGFDNFSGLKFSNNVRDRSQTLNMIYSTARNWRADDTTLSPAATKGVLADLQKLKSYKNSPIPAFEGPAWAVVDAGRIDNFGLANPPAGRHPKWKKA